MMVDGDQELSESIRPALHTLPTDIIRVIVRMVGISGNSVHSLRLISHSWSAIALEYIQFRLPIDSVRITCERSDRVAVLLKFKKLDDEQHFQGVCRGWNKNLLSRKFLSPALRISTRMDILNALFPIVILIGCYCLIDAPHHATIFLLAITAQFVYWLAVRGAVRKNCHRLARIFARCSTIDEVCLHHLNLQQLSMIQKSLADVIIKHLIIYEYECDGELKNVIFEMCRKHNVGQLTLCVGTFEESCLRAYPFEIIAITPRIEVYERTMCEENIFGQSREFWDKKEMNSERCSMKVVSTKRLRIDCAAYLYREHWLRFEIEAIPTK